MFEFKAQGTRVRENFIEWRGEDILPILPILPAGQCQWQCQ